VFCDESDWKQWCGESHHVDLDDDEGLGDFVVVVVVAVDDDDC
jgi:hypothetical protein